VGGVVVGGATDGTIPVMTGGVGLVTILVFGGVGGCLVVDGTVMRNVFSAYAVVIIFLGPGGKAVVLNSLCTFAWELFFGIPSVCKYVRGGVVLFPLAFCLSLSSAIAI
jgi:hypothetical protein